MKMRTNIPYGLTWSSLSSAILHTRNISTSQIKKSCWLGELHKYAIYWSLENVQQVLNMFNVVVFFLCCSSDTTSIILFRFLSKVNGSQRANSLYFLFLYLTICVIFWNSTHVMGLAFLFESNNPSSSNREAVKNGWRWNDCPAIAVAFLQTRIQFLVVSTAGARD